VRASIGFDPDRDKWRIEGCLGDPIHSYGGNLPTVFGRHQVKALGDHFQGGFIVGVIYDGPPG
jgi:hypothetical protein